MALVQTIDAAWQMLGDGLFGGLGSNSKAGSIYTSREIPNSEATRLRNIGTLPVGLTREQVFESDRHAKEAEAFAEMLGAFAQGQKRRINAGLRVEAIRADMMKTAHSADVRLTQLKNQVAMSGDRHDFLLGRTNAEREGSRIGYIASRVRDLTAY